MFFLMPDVLYSDGPPLIQVGIASGQGKVGWYASSVNMPLLNADEFVISLTNSSATMGKKKIMEACSKSVKETNHASLNITDPKAS